MTIPTSAGVRPWVVGTVRAVATAVALFTVTALITVLTSGDVPVELQLYASIAVLVLRSLEGYLDDRRQGAAPQAGIFRGGPLQ